MSPYQIEFLLPNANANLYHQIYLVQKSKITYDSHNTELQYSYLQLYWLLYL